ncbi:zinc finger protein ZAT5-like [Nicotiana sylvestris]|uniref:Uncharacterized protein DDB_G0283357-like n=1 Tax=Nicotiana sylvestris TaxID=4096 RepID=A0A1U7XIF4_NICSY|nr:PREDICTED: uncharacterized protein DDB_G0283357-like [Nicotiana sylvestris]XP_016443821.1 PREDICTED: putative uncharacterized protein DDB_G0289263 [Nicotiana tabacum]
MDALEEVDVGCPNKDLFRIVKGKRTKRLRLSGVPCNNNNNNNNNNVEDGRDNREDIAYNNNIEDDSGNGEGVVACKNNNNNIEDGRDNGKSIACKNNNNNNIEDGSGNGEGVVACKNNNNNIKDDSGNGEDVAYNNNTNNNNNNYSNPFSANSAEIFINTFTDEEEETAKSLILMSKLSDDHPRPLRFTLPPDNKVDFFNDDLRLYQIKFNSKRYIETSTNSANGTKAGIYVYECKTCNRTFPSFQALGGHRASHKKPKTILTTELSNKKSSYFDFSDEDDYQELSPSTTTLYKNNKNVTKTLPNSSNNKFSSPRIHECSYCGAEFTSGQALGGHMRRHRGGVNVNSPLHLSNLSPATSIDQEFGNNMMKKPRDGLSLDLNIPVSDDHIDPKFPVVSLNQQDQEQTQRQQLVDCHY